MGAEVTFILRSKDGQKSLTWAQLALASAPIEVKPEVTRPKQGHFQKGDDLFCPKHTGLGSGTKIYVHYNFRRRDGQKMVKSP